ncbi:MAG: hypothetical protein ACE366_17570 [Bradymonadia bacterium]
MHHQPCTPPLLAAALLTALLAASSLIGCTSNRAPVFEPLDDPVVTVGEILRVPVTAFDRDGGSITYGVRGLPSGARFDLDLDPPVFTWSPVASEAQAGGRLHPITFTAEDDGGAQSTARMVVTVLPGQTRPTFTSPTAFVLDTAAQAEWDVLLTVRDDDDVALTFELVEAPEGMQMEAYEKAVRLRWAPTPSQTIRQRVFPVTVSARDEEIPEPVTHPMTLLVLPAQGDP